MTAASATQPVIRVRGLTKRYGDVQAVAGIDFDVADSRGVEPQNLAIRRPTLEDVFLDLTGRALRD